MIFVSPGHFGLASPPKLAGRPRPQAAGGSEPSGIFAVVLPPREIPPLFDFSCPFCTRASARTPMGSSHCFSPPSSVADPNTGRALAPHILFPSPTPPPSPLPATRSPPPFVTTAIATATHRPDRRPGNFNGRRKQHQQTNDLSDHLYRAVLGHKEENRTGIQWSAALAMVTVMTTIVNAILLGREQWWGCLRGFLPVVLLVHPCHSSSMHETCCHARSGHAQYRVTTESSFSNL